MKVMSIGGNCSCLEFLDKNIRVPGPVDNWFAQNGFRSVFGLFTNFKEQLENGWLSREKKWVGYPGDSPFRYEYKDYSCRHINIEDPNIMEKVLARYTSFLDHWKLVKNDPSYYFTYVLNPRDYKELDGKRVLTNSTIESLKQINRYFPPEKLIVVGTKFIKLKKDGYNHYIDIVPDFINYVNIHDVKYWHDARFFREAKKRIYAQKQFNQYLKKIVDRNKENCRNTSNKSGGTKVNFSINISENPKTIQEKLIWLQFYDKSNYLKPICADKLRVREYAIEKLGIDICIPILKVYDSPDKIRLDELPEKFVIKTNHAYNQVIVCTDKTKLDENEVRKKVKGWLSQPFGINTHETHYLYIERKCYAEKLMATPGQNDLVDYKFLCFNGQPKYMQLIQDRHGPGRRLQHYDMNLKFVDIGRAGFKCRSDLKSKDVLPNKFELMKEYAKKLAKPFKFVRVDFYEIENEVYLGEMTFTPDAFKWKFDNDNAIKIGNLLDLRD